jgi:hypothetical protein
MTGEFSRAIALDTRSHGQKCSRLVQENGLTVQSMGARILAYDRADEVKMCVNLNGYWNTIYLGRK